eukprot:490794_1
MSHKADTQQERMLVSGYIRDIKSVIPYDKSPSTPTLLINALCNKFMSSCTDHCTSAQKELSKLYFSSTDAEKIWGIKKYINTCIANTKHHLQSHRNNCTLLVNSYIHIHSNILQIVINKFNNKRKFRLVILKEFQSLINIHTLQMFAFYIHINLKQRGNLYGHSILNNINNTLNQLFMMYKYTLAKYPINPFDIYYQIYTENRLLKNISNIQSEQILIDKYMSHFTNFTHTLQIMLNDKINSNDMMHKFKQFDSMKQFGNGLSYELNVTVCTLDMWPNYCMISNNICDEINKPNEIIKGMEKFSFFYKANRFHNGKTLKWNIMKGDAIIEIDFNENITKKLIVSTLQMIVLLCFNDKNIWKAKDILNHTNINKNELEIIIRGLCHPKVKILNKKPYIPLIKDNDMICINKNYDNVLDIVPVPVLEYGHKLKCKTVIVANETLEWGM